MQKARHFDFFYFLKQLNVSSKVIFFFLFSQGEYKLEKYMPPLSSAQLALGSPRRPPRGIMVQQSLTSGSPRLQLRLKCSTSQQRDGGCSEQVPQSNALIWVLKTGSLFLGIKPLGQVFFHTKIKSFSAANTAKIMFTTIKRKAFRGRQMGSMIISLL